MRRNLVTTTRRFFTTSQCRHQASSDWNSKQYLKFENERTIPVRDLLAKVSLQSPSKVIDLGCGPGNSTAVLAERYPNATIVGMDSSPDMLNKARSVLPNLEFVQADLNTYEPPKDADLLFSNAVFHWVAKDARISTMQRLLRTVKPGGILAIQMPDTDKMPTHDVMRDVARGEPWAKLMEEKNPGLAGLPPVEEFYRHLNQLCDKLNIWKTTYTHVMKDHEAIVEWVKGTGLRPYLDLLKEQDQDLFVSRYLARLKQSDYYVKIDNKVLLHYSRMFIVAIRGGK